MIVPARQLYLLKSGDVCRYYFGLDLPKLGKFETPVVKGGNVDFVEDSIERGEIGYSYYLYTTTYSGVAVKPALDIKYFYIMLGTIELTEGRRSRLDKDLAPSFTALLYYGGGAVKSKRLPDDVKVMLRTGNYSSRIVMDRIMELDFAARKRFLLSVIDWLSIFGGLYKVRYKTRIATSNNQYRLIFQALLMDFGIPYKCNFSTTRCVFEFGKGVLPKFREEVDDVRLDVKRVKSNSYGMLYDYSFVKYNNDQFLGNNLFLITE